MKDLEDKYCPWKKSKIAIMQPYFFPYIGYISLMKYADYFVFFDTPQYIRKGWINRNRILDAKGTSSYITVPVQKTARDTAIADIYIDNERAWQERILGQLSVYKRRAPFYRQTVEVVRSVIESECNLISELAIKSCIEVSRYLGMELQYDIFSKMNLLIDKVDAPDEWALRIADALQYDIYVNPPGGMEFFDNGKYQKAGIQLQFLKSSLSTYKQRIGTFIPGLSIIDVMMINSIEDSQKMLDDYVILEE